MTIARGDAWAATCGAGSAAGGGLIRARLAEAAEHMGER
jgi:hypothetical protein